jgi:triacylglycerol lipase
MNSGPGIGVLALWIAAVGPGAAQAQYSPDTPPPGANDWSCKPSAAHPDPVVLVHGLGANMQGNWSYLSPRLADAGYCVFALTYGRNTSVPFPFDQFGGAVPMEQSAEQLGAFIDDVLAATGAAKVDIVGHSEGSLMPNYYVKFLGGAAKVNRYVGLTPLWDGTNLAEVATLNELGQPSGLPQAVQQFVEQSGCGSCYQFMHGSEFLEKMNEGGAAVAGVTYTMIMTRNDELVVPYTSGYLQGAANIVIQDQCAVDPSEHILVAVDPIVARDIFNALDPANAEPVSCATLQEW